MEDRIRSLRNFWLFHIITGWISGWLFILIIVPYAIGTVVLGFFPIVINSVLFYKNMKFGRIVDSSSIEVGSMIMLALFLAVFMGLPTSGDVFVIIIVILWIGAMFGSIYLGIGFLKLGRELGIKTITTGGILYILFPPIGGLIIGLGLGKLLDKLKSIKNSDLEERLLLKAINNALEGKYVQNIEEFQDLNVAPVFLLIVLKEIFKNFPIGKLEEGKVHVKEKVVEAIKMLETKVLEI